jgi:histidinol phosphatase-like PHP family hydrolase
MLERRMLQIIDAHNHSTFSDGLLTPEQIIKKAITKGYIVGIADHLSRFHKIKTDVDLKRYILYLNQFPCYKSGELDLGQETIFSNELLDKLDYIIGGVHNLFWEGKWQNLWLMKNKIERWSEFMSLYKEVTLKAIKNPVIPFHILAHPLKLPPYLMNNFSEEEIIPEEWIEEILVYMRRHNIAIEINNSERVPSERFIRRALEMGVKVSLGSDGHNENGNCNLNWCLEIVKKLDIREDDLFRPKREVEIPEL